MTTSPTELSLEASEIELLRTTNYNATVMEVLPIHDDLRILRIVHDAGMPAMIAGQFLTLGLGNWERRIEGDDEELKAGQLRRLAKRAYSISCSLLRNDGMVHRVTEYPYLEFYIVLVRHGRQHAPSLTPRLFALQPGGRLFAGRRASGTYTLYNVRPDSNVFFFATGTGEAPHNAMVADLLARGHRGKVVNVVSVRYLRDAGYRTCHEQLVQSHRNYCYVLLTTREAQVEQRGVIAVNGLCRLQDFITSGRFENQCDAALDSANAHVFLCGNPDMIGARHSESSSPTKAVAGSMLDLLLRRGFQCDGSGPSGIVHFERYW
jgi:ferredoxin/flavodoxin---NADP+ reductase